MKRKTILSAIVSIMLCLSLISGATFALFTSESKVNIAVTSGKVQLTAAVDGDSLKTWSNEIEMANGAFALGGNAEIDGANLKINKMVPLDKVMFNIDIDNKSTTTVQYRLLYQATGELMPALKVSATIGGEETVLLKNGKTTWEFLAAGEQLDPIVVTVYFPNGDDPTTDVNEDNKYKNKTASMDFIVEALQGNASTVSKWDGISADTSWYNDTDTEFALDDAAQIAGLADLVDGGNTFEGKTIKLDVDMDLGATDENGEPIPFDPIGSYRNDVGFNGTFDGQSNTIYNMSQNTWQLNNGYAYGDLGMGFFGAVENATIKNLTMDGANLSGESALCGVVAATAFGDCTFENITVKNSNCADYQYYAGGIVGWASGDHVYKNCDVDESVNVAAQWGDFNNACGGVIGGAGGNAEILLQDCTIACRIDAYNDVTSAYQWYAYRRAGMIIGDTGKSKVVDGTTYADAPQLTCQNVTVIYGDWANYTYCYFSAMAYPWVRVQAGVSNSAYSNPRYGHPTDANGDTVVDDNHVHNAGEKHHELIVFDQLFGGAMPIYGTATHPGVTVIYNNK